MGLHKVDKILIDKFGRGHDYLRISLTERCNLRCFYCMPEEGIKLRDKANFMTTEETIAIAKQFVDLGVKKIRLTGGEPLIKKDIEHLILELSKMPIELAITTNAVLVNRFIDLFKEVGLRSINVSLDSLEEKSFNKISKRNYFNKIKSNIDLLIQHDFDVKVNVVIIKGVNEHEIPDFIDWTKNKKVDVRFIEFMPFDGNDWDWSKKVSFKEILEITESKFGKAGFVKIDDKKNDTARNYQLIDGKGSFGIISSITNPFCDTCNRIRLTADGKIKNCLFSESEIDLLTAHRKNRGLKTLIQESILNKHKERGGASAFNDDDFIKNMKNRSMTTIGG